MLQRCRLAGAAAIGLIIFLVDAFTTLGSAVAVLYVLVIVLASELGDSAAIKRSSAICAGLTVAAFLYVHGFNAETQAWLRLLFSLAANGVTTLLLLRRGIDIARRRASEAALKASEHRYRTIFETLAVAIWEHDFREVKEELEGLRDRGVQDVRRYIADHPDFVINARRKVRITDVNQTALTLMGVPTKEEFFTHLDSFLPENDESFAQCLVAIDEGHPTFQAETKVRTRQGRLIPVIVALSFPPNGEGLDRIQGSIVDITERLEFQEALEHSRRELEHASRVAMIGEISASIAHEVNQPLSATISFIQAAQRWLDRKTPDLVEAKLALQDALSATEHSANVVKRVHMLLGKAKSETGEVAIEATILDALRLKQPELGTHGTRVIFNPAAEAMITRGDRILLQQSFLNIISNAMQAMDATPAGHRILTIETESRDSEVTFRFIDSGPGLGDQVGDSLFKAFTTTKPSGMGLGLAICRSIVTAHGGSISIRNRLDCNGAVVEISLPRCLLDTLDAPKDTPLSEAGQARQAQKA
ncbi:two component sensor kinase (plasmid) [Rhizobium favelukesii]|uniref:histidine kinase n=2 Tax=Rhizobium/Agrobacterium group TaxID=227290 RepID=W6S8V3_9HYPH|nr:two component sensor kinase [Rhizobium favelukesii]